MKIAIIIDDATNISLLRFTETKLFFDAKNVSRDLVDDCVVVRSAEQAQQHIDQNPDHTYYVIPTGAFLTTSFYHKYKNKPGIHWIDLMHEHVIPYDIDTYVGFKRRSKYPPKSKQLYIIENMLKSILHAKKTVYVENTESVDPKIDTRSTKHLYGLASGWKTARMANLIGLENLEPITVYDANPYQLEWARKLHSFNQLPEHIDIPYHHVGTYSVPDWAKDWWTKWHKYPVQFKEIDLLTAPTFPDNSLIWISNVFKFEPLIFSLGWERLKEIKKQLTINNKHSIIFEQ